MTVNQSNQTLFKMEKDVFWYTTTALLILINILTILGNLMVLMVTWIERSLHQPNKYFIACLAVADLLVGIFVTPLHVHTHLNEEGITSIHLCRFLFWVGIFAESASINTLTFISFDRHLKISKPLRYNILMTTSKSFLVIFIVWSISTTYATFGMFSYRGSPGIHISDVGCTTDNVAFYTFSAVFAFFLPTIITLLMYVRIFFVAHKRRNMTQNGDLGQTYNLRGQRRTFVQDLKNIRMLTVVMGAFIFCWGPFFIMTLLYFYHPESSKFINNRTLLVSITLRILPPFNSVCNPIIYACFDEKYSKAFKRLFKRMICQSTSRNRQLPHALGISSR